MDMTDSKQPVRSLTNRKVLAALVIAGLAGATAVTGTIAGSSLSVPANAQSVMNRAPAAGFADLVEKVMPSVISVEVKFAPASNTFSESDGPNYRDLPPDNPFRHFFEQFRDYRFGTPTPRTPRRRSGMGSGFIITSDGFAVTNNHVIAGASQVTVKMHNGKSYDADVVGTDKRTDLALIKIKADDTFKAVEFAAAKPRVGDWVIAVGNPFGLGGTVTTGIISASGRNIGSGPYDDYLQIDAPINRGNSGGPAFNLNGKVVGINTAIFSPSGGSVGIGFAIPAALAQDVIADLKSNGKVTRGWLGVHIQPVSKDLAAGLGLARESGALVVEVTPSSPADKAGLKPRDTILKVGGKDIRNPRDLARKVADLKPGQEADFVIFRDGKEQTVQVNIGTLPAEFGVATRNQRSIEKPKTTMSSLGLRLAPAEDGAGVIVTRVRPGGPAAAKGLRNGDVILEIDGVEVDEPAAVRAALDRVAKSGKTRALLLVRSGQRQRFVALPVDQS